MTRLVLPITPDGAAVPVEVTLAAQDISRLRAAGRALPGPIVVPAVIDTGSDVTVFDTSVLTPLIAYGLQQTRFIFTNTPAAGGLAPTLEYSVGLVIGGHAARSRSGLRLPVHLVYERALGAIGYRALIGRDVLAHCGFFYDGPGRQVTLLV